MLIAILAISTMFTFNSCNEDDVTSVALHSFGPCPVLRGNTIKIIGTDLTQVTKVVFPSNVEVSQFESKTNTQIVVTVPQEAVPGQIKLIYNGGEITSKSKITFEEPISVTSVSPTSVTAGDVITVTGDYVYNIATATFADNVVVEAADFVSSSRKELKITVPKAAVSGKITFSDGADVPTLIEYETPLEITTATYISMDRTELDMGEQVVITGTNLQLIESVIYPGDITDETFSVSADGTQITTTVPTETCSGVITLKQFSGNSISTDAFTVPTITYESISPSTNLQVGDEVTIKGTNLGRVIELQLPGGTVIKPGDSSFAIDNSGLNIKFIVPESMVDGAVTMVQNSNISVTTDNISMKKMGNVFWTGNFELGNWAQNLEVAAEKADAVWEAFSSTIKGTGKLTVNFTLDESATWWQLKPCYRSDWNTGLGGLTNSIVEMAAGQDSYTLNINEADYAMLNANGWAFGGCNMTITSMEWESADVPTTIWEGSLVLDGNWGNSTQISADKFASLTTSSKIYFYYTLDTTSTYWQIKPMDGGWTALSYAFTVDPTYQCIPMTEGSTEFSMEVNAADVTALQSSGMVISGCWLTVTKVAIK